MNNKASVPRFNQRRSLVPSDSDSDLEPEPESESQTQPQPQPQLQQLEPALLQNVEQVDTEEDATVFDSMDQKSLQAKGLNFIWIYILALNTYLQNEHLKFSIFFVNVQLQ